MAASRNTMINNVLARAKELISTNNEEIKRADIITIINTLYPNATTIAKNNVADAVIDYLVQESELEILRILLGYAPDITPITPGEGRTGAYTNSFGAIAINNNIYTYLNEEITFADMWQIYSADSNEAISFYGLYNDKKIPIFIDDMEQTNNNFTLLAHINFLNNDDISVIYLKGSGNGDSELLLNSNFTNS